MNAVLGHELEIRPVAGHGEDEIVLQRHFAFGVSSTTSYGRISLRELWKYAFISPLLMRFSMFGLIQYFTLLEMPAPR